MSKRKQTVKVTWAQAVRDIVITAMNRGQLPVLFLLFIVALIVWRLPVDLLLELIKYLIDLLKKAELIAYILLFIVCTIWFFHSKHLRRQFSKEVERIGKEKSNLQRLSTGKNFKSSDS